jgi:hypothetical protein
MANDRNSFVLNSEVKPEIAAVLGRPDQLLFTPEMAQQLHEQSEAGLADVVEETARFVRGQRYTSLAALKRQPRTTAELLRYQREN